MLTNIGRQIEVIQILRQSCFIALVNCVRVRVEHRELTEMSVVFIHINGSLSLRISSHMNPNNNKIK